MWSKTAGFSLIEVLVAFTIMAVSIGALLVAFSGGIKNTAVTRDYNRAVIIAESRLAEIGMLEPLAAEQAAEGRDGRFHWTTTVESTDDEPIGKWRLLHVSVRVTWQVINATRTLEINSLRWARDA